MKVNKASMDGNMAAAHISYFFTEVAAIFPITPSSPMAELVDEWSSSDRKNMFDQSVKVVEMQSEGGAAGTMHGSLGAGALTTTYTASQGLLLMIPNLYKMAGELLPGVFHVSARTISVHALSIFGDHSDVMACRQTGAAMLCSESPQEAMDLGAVAHLSAIKGRVPFLHFFDGFRTSHEIQKIDVLDYEDIRPLVDREAVLAFRKRALNPEHPVTRGTTQNPDIFFQQREAANPIYEVLPQTVEQYMNEINKLTGRNYKLFNYYGAEDPTDIIIAMGSVCGTIQETVDYLVHQGRRVGMMSVKLYRPFSVEHFLKELPPSVERIAVLDRTKEPGAVGEPLYLDITNVLRDSQPLRVIIGGRYGLASKETTPGDILAVFENLSSDKPKNSFTIGIEDDLTHHSLARLPEPYLDQPGDISCKIWGLGSDGTVGANKNSVKIIGEATDLYTQAYFVYDSKKSGGLTQSHLRFSKSPIRSTYLIKNADFIACHNAAYIHQYDLTADLKTGGVFLLNCSWDIDELEQNLPAEFRRGLAMKQAKLYIIDADNIARELGLGGRINTVLQAAFFKLTNIVPLDNAIEMMKQANQQTYYLKGQATVESNNQAVDAGIDHVMQVEIPEDWIRDFDHKLHREDRPDFITKIANVMNKQAGDQLPVSAFVGMEDGSFPPGATAYEKRGIAFEVPQWVPDHCIQCNRCSLVCPHAAIRPFLLNATEEAMKPSGFETIAAVGKDYAGLTYRLQVSPLDCTGCGSCASVCPANPKALMMSPINEESHQQSAWSYAMNSISYKQFGSSRNVKSSQFYQPMFEFSGACAGCGETPYIKLLTQLFGERMYIANASGCSTAFGGSVPSTPYTTNKDGRGPAWAMSLFEDNAEYALGMLLASNHIREKCNQAVKLLVEQGLGDKGRAYLENNKDLHVINSLIESLQKINGQKQYSQEAIETIMNNQDYLTKKTVWAIGGDGWAYDIGYGGLDHVLASGQDINVLVLDTEVYSNTGGQASKATPPGAIAKFAYAGKETLKKDLGRIAMSYGNIYVAKVAMGANPEQCLRAFREAEAYNGPSLIIAYCPCIEHGIAGGMKNSQYEMKRAVESGYWNLYRFDPSKTQTGDNPFQLDSKLPSMSVEDFMAGENRFTALGIRFADRSAELTEKAKENADKQFKILTNFGKN